MGEKIRVGSDFSGIGAFDQALLRLGITHRTVFACDMDKFARQAYIANYGEPDYYPENVYNREIPKEPLDIYMTSPPCQAFSLAGKRKGEDDKRGVLFYNSHEFIQKNRPRYFIFENVKGLLSDDSGKTFQRWLDFLGGKSVNGNPVIFPHEESVPYHIYWKVLNAKHYGVPQNRERVFIIGIRDDVDNDFRWPKPFPLTKKLKDVLEDNVDEKYFLSDKLIHTLFETSSGSENQFSPAIPVDVEKISPTITARIHKMGRQDPYLKIKSATSKGYETATENDSINFSHPNSETRRGRVGKEVAQTLDTACNQGVISKIENWYSEENKEVECEDIIQTGQTNMKGQRIYKTGISPTLPAENPRVATVINKQNETGKILRLLREEIGEKEIRTWGLRILETIREEEVLRQGVHEESVQGKTKKKSKRPINKVQSEKSKRFNANVIMRSLPKEAWEGCSPQRRKSIKQLIRKLNESLSELPHEDSQTETNLQSRELQYEGEGVGILRKALSKIQEIWESINGETQPIQSNYRIRRLTVREVLRLMDFPDSFKIVCSDSQTYKQAGNSIVVACLEKILDRLLNK